jgi:HEPN domain-containing protein
MVTFEDWLAKAQQDLRASKELFKLEDDLLGISAYHAQQCAEKTLKAYLSFKNQSIQKTHNLVVLVELCKKFNFNFNKFLNDAAVLNPYSSKFRYPDDILAPERSDVEIAINISNKIMNFVKKEVNAKPDPNLNIFDLKGE